MNTDNQLDKKTVLLVEDDPNLNELNRRVLTDAGYNVVTAMSISEARLHLESSAPDAILLDIKLPDGSGIDLCKEIRQVTAAPILFVTSVKGHEQMLEGLASGGDDYIVKPYDISLLLAKVEAFLRRDEIIARKHAQNTAHTDTIERPPLKLDIVAGQAYINDENLQLTPKEFTLLRILVQNEGQPQSVDKLYERAWNLPAIGDNRAIQVRISTLRAKLNGSGFEIAFIHGQGYCFRRIDK